MLNAERVSSDLVAALVSQTAATGSVHSVFASVVNILLDEGLLITVLAKGRGLQPYSLSLNQEGVSFLGLGLSPGDLVSLDKNSLCIGCVVVAIGGAEVVSLAVDISGAVFDTRSDEYTRRLRVLTLAIANAAHMPDGIAPVLCNLFDGLPYVAEQNVFSRFLTERIRRLYGVLLNRDVGACAEIGRGLAGCGPGLTPSSDDFLTGIFAALYAAAVVGVLSPETAQGLCQKLAEGAAPNTGVISASFINSGARGSFNEPVVRLLSAFFTSDASELAVAAERVCALGSTSGADILTGIWFGLAAAAQMPLFI